MKQYDPACRQCPRLADFLGEVRAKHPSYFAKPVPPFGDPKGELVVVGLAPGMHGANRTGRPFTGDYAGILLFKTLHNFGFGSHEGTADPGDGLELINCRITNAVKCLPPQNKPEGAEVRRCNPFLAAELSAVQPKAILALGAVAHRAVLMAMSLPPKEFAFGHHRIHDLPPALGMRREIRLFSSYHCSRYNTQTRRLTADMFEAVVRDIRNYLAVRK